MKTTLNTTLPSRTGKPAPTRSRLTKPRVPRKLRPAANGEEIQPATATASAEPTVTAEPDVTPVESLHGDAYLLYLREIGKVKLLTPAEEIALAKRIKRGDPEARELMIKANLRLVVKIARDYEGMGLPLLDLINEGNIGLMKGVKRFDPNRGAKLSTYASWWIKQAIKRALANQSKTIRLPVHVVDKLAHIRRAEARLHRVLDREPTDDEVATDLGIDARRVRQYREASRPPVSLDSPIGDENSAAISEIVADPSAAAPFDRLVSDTDHELVREVLAKLDARESRILAMRFGLDDGKPKTLEEVGELVGVTRERIRQIQEQALQKMRVQIEKRDEPSESALALMAA